MMNRKSAIFTSVLVAGTTAMILVSGCSGPPMAGSTLRGAQEASQARIDAVRLNTLGVANMTQQRTEAALELFEQAYQTDASFTTARLNEAIARFNVQQFEQSVAILSEITSDDPNDARAWYNLGLSYRNLGRSVDAVAAFERVVTVDPSDPDSHYLLGLMHSQIEQYDEAIASYENALGLSPYHASATFGLAGVYRMRRQVDQALEIFARYTEITAQELSTPFGSAYGDQGPYSLAQDASDLAERPTNSIDVQFVQAGGLDFVHNTTADSIAGILGGGVCVVDFDDDDAQDLLLMDGGDTAGRLYRNLGGGAFDDVTESAGIRVTGTGIGCTVGDFDNDTLVDLAISTSNGLAILRNLGTGAFEDVSATTGIDIGTRDDGIPLGLTFIDFDHDSDLDLYVARSNDLIVDRGQVASRPATTSANMLWRNNGNGTFTDWTGETALDGLAAGIGAVGTDINNDRAIDFVVTGWGNSPEIFLNPRTGEFDRLEWTGGDEPILPTGVIVADFNKDTWMDLAFTQRSAPGLSVWQNVDGKSFDRVSLPSPGWSRGWGITPIDYDNDGWIDLAAVGEGADSGEIRVYRNRGIDGFEEVTSELGMDGIPLTNPRALVGADYDNDGDVDLLVTQNAGTPLLLRNDGGNANGWLRVNLEGLVDNRSGIGTKVEMFSGILRQKVEVQASGGYLGQSALPITFGLGENSEADTVRMLWPTGVPQDETQLAGLQAHNILESDRRGSSCPVLFCWDGESYQFVTDAIGAGVVGHWVAPGQRNISDPTEYIKIPGSSVELRDGMLSFRLAEPMEELVYLDQVRLLAVDHPDDVDVYPHEYFAAIGPFPEFEIIASRRPRLPAGAWDDQGQDVSEELAVIDRLYVTGFDSAPFKGFAQTHYLELDIGDIDLTGPVRLLMHGFIDYFSATSVFAAHQAGIEPISPTIEAENAAGEWIRVIDDLGFPAGLARTMARDITGLLPEGTRRIRITTNLMIYWDQILIDTTPDSIPIQLTEVPLSQATLGWLGYPRAVEGAIKADVQYVYDEVSPTGPYARHAGSYTRYGDVVDLSSDADDMFVIFGSGEEVALEFDPSGMPELQGGWTRDYFFFADGFAKDMDFYEAYSGTVEPLPYHTEEPYPYASGRSYPTTDVFLDYQLQSNTRHVSGRRAAAYHYVYE